MSENFPDPELIEEGIELCDFEVPLDEGISLSCNRAARWVGVDHTGQVRRLCPDHKGLLVDPNKVTHSGRRAAP